MEILTLFGEMMLRPKETLAMIMVFVVGLCIYNWLGGAL